MKAVVGLCVLAALALVPAPGWAEDPIGRFSLGGSVGYSSYALADVNERINGVGNRYLEEEHVPPLTGLEDIGFGWTFWGDLKTEVPFLDGFFVSGGYGVSSGNSESPDMDNKLRVEVSQKAYHVRLLYVPPWRPQEDTRLFVGGGPLIITKQEVRVTQENRSVLDEPWTEEIFYEGTGLGWQFGVIAEYMIQDRLSLAFDLGYRLASITYSDDWSSRQNVILDYPPTADAQELDRLHYDQTYIGHAFLDWEETLRRGEDDPLLEQYGPHYEEMAPVSQDDLEIDLSGVQIHLGVRFYFL